MRILLIGVAPLLLATACGSTADQEPVVVPARPQQVVATDPRVGELQVMVAELLDRVEVLSSRLQRVEAGAPERAAAGSSSPANSPSRSSGAESRPRLAPAQVADTYRQAMEMYGKGEIDRSRATFQRVFDADPSGDLADNALYWIGETYYSTGKYGEAIAQYQKIQRDYASANKAPDAILKMGMAYARQGDLSLARRTYEMLIERYPYSTAAAAARAEIRRVAY